MDKNILRLDRNTNNPEDMLRLINRIHPAAVNSWDRQEFTCKWHGETIIRQVALKTVKFSGIVTRQFRNVKSFHPEGNNHSLFWVNDIIECDGERYEGNQIEYIEIELLEYDPFRPDQD